MNHRRNGRLTRSEELAEIEALESLDQLSPTAAAPAQAPFNVNIDTAPDGAVQYRPNGKWSPAAATLIHRATVDVHPYRELVAHPDSQSTAIEYVEQYLAEMQPRSPAERMFAIQMLWQHARISRLTTYAATEQRCKQLDGLNNAIDSAMSVYRRQVQTWNELRTPRPVQINVGKNQLIAQGCGPKGLGDGVSSNHQGCGHEQAPAPALPFEPVWPGFTTAGQPEREAVAAVHRAEDAAG